MYWFPSVTNYHKFSGLNNTNLLSNSYGDQKSQMGLIGLNSRCGLDCIPFWRFFLGESIPCLFQLPEAAYISWFVAPIQELHHSHSASVLTSFSLSLTHPSPSSTFKRTLVITLGPPGQSKIISSYQDL